MLGVCPGMLNVVLRGAFCPMLFFWPKTCIHLPHSFYTLHLNAQPQRIYLLFWRTIHRVSPTVGHMTESSLRSDMRVDLVILVHDSAGVCFLSAAAASVGVTRLRSHQPLGACRLRVRHAL